MKSGSERPRIARTVAQNCKSGPCPHVYEFADGSFGVQGDEVHPDLPVGVDISTDERIVRIPREVAVQFAEHIGGGAG